MIFIKNYKLFNHYKLNESFELVNELKLKAIVKDLYQPLLDDYSDIKHCISFISTKSGLEVFFNINRDGTNSIKGMNRYNELKQHFINFYESKKDLLSCYEIDGWIHLGNTHVICKFWLD